jgi:NADH:ubiquinone oxidoreductase subunit K
MSLSPVTIGVIGVLGLLGAGLYGLLISRNLIKVVIAMQLLGKAAVLAMIAAGTASGKLNLSQSFAITVLVADTIVAIIGLALAVQIKRRSGSLDIRDLSSLRG